MNRAHVHLLTGGMEGRSPHFVADVLSLLRARGHDAIVTYMTSDPLRIAMTIDGLEGAVRLSEATPTHCWLFVAIGNKIVRVNALRSLDVTVSFEDALAETDWLAHWPRVADVSAFDPVASYVARHGFRTTPASKLLYLSELAVVEAIELAQNAPSEWALSEQV